MNCHAMIATFTIGEVKVSLPARVYMSIDFPAGEEAVEAEVEHIRQQYAWKPDLSGVLQHAWCKHLSERWPVIDMPAELRSAALVVICSYQVSGDERLVTLSALTWPPVTT